MKCMNHEFSFKHSLDENPYFLTVYIGTFLPFLVVFQLDLTLDLGVSENASRFF